MKKYLYFFLLLPVFVFSQSADQNYIMSITYKIPYQLQEIFEIGVPPLTVPLPDKIVNITYYDGLGRPSQQVSNGLSGSGKDIITHIEYDAFGRQVKEYLPYGGSDFSGNYRPSALSETLSFYSSPPNPNSEATGNPFSEKTFEASPLNRVLKQGAPGNDWAVAALPTDTDHAVKFEYQVAAPADAVRRFTAFSTWDAPSGLYIPALTNNGNYILGQVYKTITKDENWTASSGNNHTTQEFKDKEGRVILKRSYDQGVPHDTYYVYDQYGNLSYVIPPLSDGSISQLDGLCYQYKYDKNNRLAEKKLPGKAWEFIVYDKLDRIVATGPALVPFGGLAEGWLVSKYDIFNRIVYTGWYAGHQCNSAERANIQLLMNNATALSESRSVSNVIDNISIGYTNTAFPTLYYYLLTINYYDNYNFPNAIAVPQSVESQPVLAEVKGLATGSWTRMLTNEGEFNGEASQFFYDTKGRIVRTSHKNHMDGYDIIDSRLDFIGKTEYSIKHHEGPASHGGYVFDMKDNFSYTEQDRLLTHTHQLDPNSNIVILAQNEYDELGQLIRKNVGGYSPGTPYQKIDYKYNIRGWLTDINDINNLSIGSDPRDLFAFHINYNTVDADLGGNVKQLYNGNISETYWRAASDNTIRKYGYRYDAMNRMLNAYYQKPNPIANYTRSYDESVTYDKNGNIASLIRNGELDSASDVIEIDNLAYAYDPLKKNQLMRVTDGTNNTSKGFKDGTNTDDDYAYDANGNMTSDKNKGIANIIYNHLNLPVKIQFGEYQKIEYFYDSRGIKKKKIVSDTRPWVSPRINETDYLNGIQYLNNDIEFISIEGGYLSAVEGYVFNYTDHLGNVRVSFSENDSQNIIAENNYYPFGLNHGNYNSIPVGQYGTNKYKYNGKEFQDELGLNVTAMDWRQYDPAIGRFVTIDPETDEPEQLDKSPYAFAWNNPVLNNDPDGRNPIKGLLKKILKSLGDDGVKIVARTTKGSIKPVSRVHAEKLLKNGKTVMKTTDGSSNKAAKKLMKSASGDSQVVRHDGHELTNVQGQKTGKTGLDHFQKKSGDGSHVLYNTAKNGAIVAGGTSEVNSPETRELAGKAASLGKDLSTAVENPGTSIFGDNDFGRALDELNPLNVGVSQFFNWMDGSLNKKKE